mmetsp:Transcript_23449/g.30453  ORF Transcript_23449/g.30453 Transcript_23449/m.30453 type:complete len:116 (-) Transcript_23449:247-594(-)
MRSVLFLLSLLAILHVGEAFVAPMVVRSESTTLSANRRNTKKEKRQRNMENMRKFKRGPAAAAPRGGRGKKTLSRKKLTLKEQALKEKARESEFTAKLFVKTGGPSEEKLDLGVL